MNILMLNYEFPPIGGGASNYTFNLLKEFSKYDTVSLDLITSSSEDLYEKIPFSDNVNIYRLPINKKDEFHWTQKEIISYSVKCYYLIKKIMKEKKFDLIHAIFGIPSGLIAYLYRKKIPYIVSLRGSDVPGFNKRFSFHYLMLKPIIRRIWKNARIIIANSQDLKSLAQRTSKDVKIDIIPNGVNISEFHPSDHNKNKNPIILTIARLTKRKGVDDLIKAIPMIVKYQDSIKVRIIGGGKEEKKLKKLARKADVFQYVDFTGHMPYEGISRHYSSADIFVLPSRNEGMSNTILEAMASSLPIITTDTGGANELIAENGIIIPKNNPYAIANAILSLLNDHKLIREMGKKSRHIAGRNSWEYVAKKYLDVYKTSI